MLIVSSRRDLSMLGIDAICERRKRRCLQSADAQNHGPVVPCGGPVVPFGGPVAPCGDIFKSS